MAAKRKATRRKRADNLRPFIENVVKPLLRRKAKPKGLVVTVNQFPRVALFTSSQGWAGEMNLSDLRRAGWRPTAKPAKWRVTFERVEE